MTLRSYLRIFRERFVVFALVTLLCIAISVLITALTPKTYTADAQVFVTSNTNEVSPVDQNNGQAAVIAQVQTYAQLIGSPQIISAVRSDLGLRISDDDLRAKITATAPDQQALVIVTATDGDARQSARLANSAAVAFAETVAKLSTPSGSNRSPVRLTVTREASTPSSPTTPRVTINIAIGGILGLLLGASAAVLRDLLDSRMKDIDVLAGLAQAPALGAIVEDRRTKMHPIASSSARCRDRAETFRQLRANVQFADDGDAPRVIGVTSSVSAEGKSAVALNLASSLASGGHSVCLVDANLRDPAIGALLDLPDDTGLSTVITGRSQLDASLVAVSENLRVLASGPVPPNPSELLASDSARRLILGLRDSFDYVVLDSAALLPVADGAEVAGLCEGVIFVARRKFTTESQVLRSVDALERVGAPLLGVVLNRVPPEGLAYSQRGRTAEDHDLDFPVVGRERPSPRSRHHAEETR